MKSVGEVMSIGRTFCESLQKAARSLETARDGLVSLVSRVDYRLLAEPKKKRDPAREAAKVEPPKSLPPPSPEDLVRALRTVIPIPVADRLFYVADAMRAGIDTAEIHQLTKIDPWFLAQIERIVKAEERIARGDVSPAALRSFKRLGFSDAQLGKLTGSCAEDV